MDIKRKIATYYLKRQYNNAKKYLERKLINGELHEGETIELICNIVRNAGIAYAQAEFCVFTENGSLYEDNIAKLDIETNKIHHYSAFDEFIREMDTYISEVISKGISSN